MSWLGSLQDLENNSGQSELLEESLKNKLRTFQFQKDERQSSEDESFQLAPVLFRRHISKTGANRSYIRRIIDNYRKQKDIAENAEKQEASAENSRPSNLNRISSTPFHITDAKVPSEESLILSPIYTWRKNNKQGQPNCLAQAQSAKEVLDTKLQHENAIANNVSEKRNQTKTTKVIGSNTKKTPKTKKTALGRHTKSYNTKKTKERQVITKRLNKTNAENNAVLNKNNMITYMALNPDRRRTFIEQSSVYLNDKAFDLDEELECEPLAQILNYHCEEMDCIFKPLLKNKVRILDDIIITKTGISSKVKQPVLPKSNKSILALVNVKTPIVKKDLTSGGKIESSQHDSDNHLKSSFHSKMKTRGRVLENQNKSHKKKIKSIVISEETSAKERSISKTLNKSLAEITPYLNNVENIDPHLSNISPVKKTSFGVSNSNKALNNPMKNSNLIEQNSKMKKSIRKKVNPAIEDDSPKDTVNVDESEMMHDRILRKRKNVDYNPLKKRKGALRKQKKIEEIDNPILINRDISNEDLKSEAANDITIGYKDKPIEEERPQEFEPFIESVQKSQEPTEKKLETVDESNRKRRARPKKALTDSRMPRRVAGNINEVDILQDSVRKLRDKSKKEVKSQKLKHVVNAIRDEELYAAHNSQIDREISQVLEPIANSVQEHTGKTKENPKTDSFNSIEYAQMNESIQERRNKSVVKSPLELESINDSKQKRQKRSSKKKPESEELKEVNNPDVSRRDLQILEPPGDLVKKRLGRPMKVQQSRQTSNSNDTHTTVQEDECFIKPMNPPPRKAITRDISVSPTYLQELSENAVSTKRRRGRPRKASAVKQTPVQVEDITTTSSIATSNNSTTSYSIRTSGRNRQINTFINIWYSGLNEAEFSKDSGSKLRPRILSSPKKRLSTITKKKEKSKKMVRKGRDLRTILEESRLLSERHNINLELENNDHSDNNLHIDEQIHTDSTQLKDSGLPTDSQNSNLLTTDSTNNDGLTATTKSSVFAPRENVYKHFIFDLQKDSENEANPFITLPIPKDVESKVGRIIMKPGFRKPNITLKNHNLTLFVSSGTGIYTLQNQSARLSKHLIVRAYDGNEYSIYNDGAKELNLIYFTYPSKKEGT